MRIQFPIFRFQWCLLICAALLVTSVSSAQGPGPDAISGKVGRVSKPLPLGPNVEDDALDFHYGTPAAKKLVQEGRQFDPEFANGEMWDRDRAVALYADAIKAQPGAKLNAQLANRIAQIYAFNGNPAKGVKPNYAKAAEWWQRCLELTDRSQILWGQAQMGLASSCGLLPKI